MTFQVEGELLIAFVLAMTRAIAWLLIAPPFSSGSISNRIKVGLAAALALGLGPHLQDQAIPLETGPIVTSMVLQVAIGVALGFVTLVLFSVFQMAGAALDLFGAFAMSQLLDPMSGEQASLFGRIFNLVATVMLFATGGHLLLVRGFLHSFEAVPVDGFRSDRLADIVTTDVSALLIAALQIGAPVLAAIFLADIALGLLSRAAPEMNVFMLGMPLKVFITLSLVGLVLPAFPQAVSDFADTAVVHALGVGG